MKKIIKDNLIIVALIIVWLVTYWFALAINGMF